MIDRIEQSKALASPTRVKILDWLREPRLHFGHQDSADPATVGVCVTLFVEKLQMSQPTVSRHLEVLLRADFVRVERIGRWSYFSRSEDGLQGYRKWVNEHL